MGGFGTVYEATWRGRRVAVKKLPQVRAGPAGSGSSQSHSARWGAFSFGPLGSL